MHYTRQATMLDGSSAQSSNRTSNDFLVTDANQISISYLTAAAVASNLTVQGSNDDGLSATGINYSTVSVVAAQGIFTITPGARWIRVIRAAADSRSSVVINYQSW